METKLNYKRTFLIGLAFLSICSFWQMYDNIIPLILQNTYHLGETMTGAVMALDNVLAIFLLPVCGMLSDKVHTKLGRRMPFIVAGTILAVIFMMLLPMIDNAEKARWATGGSFSNQVFFLGVLFLTLVSMGLYRSPAVALMPDVTPKPLRSKGNAIINLMGAVGIIAALGLIMLLVGDGDTPNYEPLFISIAVIMLLSLAILLWKVDENRFVAERIEIEEAWGIEEEETEIDEKGNAVLPKPVKRSLTFLLLSVAFWYMAYNGVTTAFSKYATEMWGMAGGGFASALMVASIGALISFVPVGIISSRLGRKKVILFGVLLLAASFFAAFLFQTPNFGINIVFLLVGIAWASINVNSYPMVVEMCKGSDIGKFTGMYYTFSMAAQVLTPVLSGAFLEHIGYWTLFPYATVFSLIAFLTMLMVRHGDSKPQPPKGRLEAFDVDD